MSSLLFFVAMLLAVVTQAIFALFEMSSVSFNKMRLRYFVSIGKKPAIWLSRLIERPSYLFGTTLIGLTASLQIGSECARRFYESVGFDPDLAPVSQALLVVIFGELVPMFTARRHPQPIALGLAPIMLLVSKILTPFIWIFDGIATMVSRLQGQPKMPPLYLSREEVQKAFEIADEVRVEFSSVMGKVFQIKNQQAKQVMIPIDAIQSIPANATLQQAKEKLLSQFNPFLPVHFQTIQNVVGILFLRDLLGVDPQKRVTDRLQPPWFVTARANLIDILEQFRKTRQKVAVIIDDQGHAIGFLSLDQIIDAIFGPEHHLSMESEKETLYVTRTIPGSMSALQFNHDFQADISFEPDATVSDLIVEKLGHLPIRGEVVQVGKYELTVIEPSIRGAKSVSVQSTEF